MKTLLRMFLALLLFCIAPLRAEPPAKPAPIPALPVGNRVFLDATVRRADAFTARITHATGAATVPAWELSDAQQRTFGFDPAAVSAEVARRAAVKQAADDAAHQVQRDYILGIEKTLKQREEQERMASEKMLQQKQEQERIAAENREEDRRVAAARAKLNALLKNEATLQKDGALKRLHDLNLLIGRAAENLRAYEERERSNALLMASPGDQLAAAGLMASFQQRGPMSAAEFSVLDPSTKRQIQQFMPEMMPKMPHTGQLGAWEIERDRLETEFVRRLAAEERAKTLGQVVR